MYTHIDLFSGGGGFSLAAEWMGWETIIHCESHPFARRLLEHHFPKTPILGNIKEIDFTPWKGKADVLTGGFPCQPFSISGKRKGTSDDRYLWPEMLRAIREIQPRWVVPENVYGIVNWNGGLVFETVCADLENEGYEVQPYVLPACGVDAPHRRYRVFFIGRRLGAGAPVNANNNDASGTPRPRESKTKIERLQERHKIQQLIFAINARPKVELFDTDDEDEKESRREPQQSSVGAATKGKSGRSGGGITRKRILDRWRDFPTVSPVFARNDGFSDWLDGITVPSWLKGSAMIAGNAVVPELVYRIFKTIEAYDSMVE